MDSRLMRDRAWYHPVNISRSWCNSRWWWGWSPWSSRVHETSESMKLSSPWSCYACCDDTESVLVLILSFGLWPFQIFSFRTQAEIIIKVFLVKDNARLDLPFTFYRWFIYVVPWIFPPPSNSDINNVPLVQGIRTVGRFNFDLKV